MIARMLTYMHDMGDDVMSWELWVAIMRNGGSGGTITKSLKEKSRSKSSPHLEQTLTLIRSLLTAGRHVAKQSRQETAIKGQKAFSSPHCVESSSKRRILKMSNIRFKPRLHNGEWMKG